MFVLQEIGKIKGFPHAFIDVHIHEFAGPPKG
jgi:hypothetical protein